MSRLLRLLRLKLLDLLGRPSLWLLMLVLPVCFGLVAGAANEINRRPDIALAVTDHDDSAASRQLLASLADHGWDIRPADDAAAEILLLRQKVEGVVTIDAGFDAGLADIKEPHVHYTQVTGSLVTTVVREAIAAAILPIYSRRVLYSQLADLYTQSGQAVPADLQDRFSAELERSLQAESKVTIEYFGSLVITPTLTFVVSDYSLEVFFLSIYAVMGSLALAGQALRQRLGTTRDGLLLDYAISLLALLILGLLQISVYTLAMQLMMPTALRLADLGWLAVFLFFMLGFGQLLAMINESIRLFLSLLILLLLAVAGGCFFQLSSLLLSYIGQYTPHGWVLSRMRGYAALPAFWVILLALVLMVLGYWLQKKRVSQID